MCSIANLNVLDHMFTEPTSKQPISIQYTSVIIKQHANAFPIKKGILISNH